MSPTRVRFGLVAPSSKGEAIQALEVVARGISAHAGVELEPSACATYEALAARVNEGSVEAAWLPPIVLVRVGEAVAPLGFVDRGGGGYEAALVVREDSGIESVESLRGTRAGWVDPWSAAGFVMPRVKLALVGVDPRSLFRTERFHGSHRAALEALVEGSCDVVGTHAQANEEGVVASGAWSAIADARVRVLATFGAIPPDVVAVRADTPAPVRASLLEGFRLAAEDAAVRAAMMTVFGGATLREGRPAGYAGLESALAFARERGLFD